MFKKKKQQKKNLKIEKNKNSEKYNVFLNLPLKHFQMFKK